MKKSELRTRDLVTLRNGTVGIVLLGMKTNEWEGDCLVALDAWSPLSDYNEDLTMKKFGLSDTRVLDIVKVERTEHPFNFLEFCKKKINA